MAFDSSSPLLTEGEFSEDRNILLNAPKKKSKCSDVHVFPTRYIVVLLCIFGTFSIYATRVSVSIGLVCMVNHTAILQYSRPQNYTNSSITSCPPTEEPVGLSSNGSHKRTVPNEDGPFVWNEEVQGIILSSFYWGYITTQLAGGYMADNYGAKWVWGFSLLTSSLLTMLIPFAAHIGPTMLIFLQILNGAAQGFTFPSLCSITSKWTTIHNRTMIVTLCTMGVPLGIFVTYSLAPVLCTSPLLGGWPSLFYILGFIGILWFGLWSFLIYDNPSVHPWITQKEKLYIESNNLCASESQLINISWKRMLKSTPLWAMCICDFCQAYKFFMMITQLPTYLKVVLNFNLRENGLINSLNPLISPVYALFFGWLADYIIRREIISVSALRKSITITDTVITSSCLVLITLVTCQKSAFVVLIMIATFAESLSTAGIMMNPYDLSPNFAGTIKGIVQTFSSLAGILAPYVIGLLTKNNNTKSSWNVAFYIAIGLYLFGGMVFVIFGSGDIQPWNNAGNIQDDGSKKEDDECITLYARKTKMMKGIKMNPNNSMVNVR